MMLPDGIIYFHVYSQTEEIIYHMKVNVNIN
jgi:hypothetical protein